MTKSELFGPKNMFPSNNIASVGVRISSPHREGVFVCAFYTSLAGLYTQKASLCVRSGRSRWMEHH